ncbi:MAG: hypothetical protein RPT11_11380, partial [Bermanella sp.]
MARTIWLLIFACWLMQPAHGSEVLKVGLSHRQGSEQAFSGIADLSVTQIETELNFPLAMRPSPAGLWVQGLQFREHRFALSGAENSVRRFYRLSLPLELHPRMQGRWQYLWRLEPAYHSDESLFQQTRFLFEYAASAHYRMNRKARWVMGIRQDSRFGQEQLYPVFGLETRPNKRWHHRWVFPDFYSEVKIKRNTYGRVFLHPSGGKWRYLQADGSVASFGITDWNVGVSWRQKTRSPFFMRLELGSRIMGKGSVAGEDGDLSSAFYFLLSMETQ